jgi:hypothetical protein
MKIARTASVIVCDDILFGLTGKGFLQGVYAGDITIHGNALAIPQLVFYFTAETPKERPFKKMTLKVVPFGTAATELDLPIESIPQSMNPTRPKMIVRAPVLVQQIMLRPGKIETTVITESEELDAGGIWVMPIAPALP